MTIKEALTTLVGIPVASNAIDLALLDNGVSGTTTYDPLLYKMEVENALIDVLFSIVMLQSQSEGDASISYNYEGIRQRLLFLAKSNGRVDVTDYLAPTIDSHQIW